MLATIFGGISAEIQRANYIDKQHELNIDFVYFSLNLYKMKSEIQVSTISYLSQLKEQVEVGPEIQELLDVMNPGLRYQFIE